MSIFLLKNSIPFRELDYLYFDSSLEKCCEQYRRMISEGCFFYASGDMKNELLVLNSHTGEELQKIDIDKYLLLIRSDPLILEKMEYNTGNECAKNIFNFIGGIIKKYRIIEIGVILDFLVKMLIFDVDIESLRKDLIKIHAAENKSVIKYENNEYKIGYLYKDKDRSFVSKFPLLPLSISDILKNPVKFINNFKIEKDINSYYPCFPVERILILNSLVQKNPKELEMKEFNHENIKEILRKSSREDREEFYSLYKELLEIPEEISTVNQYLAWKDNIVVIYTEFCLISTEEYLAKFNKYYIKKMNELSIKFNYVL